MMGQPVGWMLGNDDPVDKGFHVPMIIAGSSTMIVMMMMRTGAMVDQKNGLLLLLLLLLLLFQVLGNVQSEHTGLALAQKGPVRPITTIRCRRDEGQLMNHNHFTAAAAAAAATAVIAVILL
jgi:hypothetical protein